MLLDGLIHFEHSFFLILNLNRVVLNITLIFVEFELYLGFLSFGLFLLKTVLFLQFNDLSPQGLHLKS